MINDRIRNKQLRSKIVSAYDAAMLIKDGMNVGTSGFARAGYPKAVTLALAEQVKHGRNVKINVWTGASVGKEIDESLASVGALGKRLPYQSLKSLRDKINRGEIGFVDQHLSHTPEMVRRGQLGHLDVAIIEAVAITEVGCIVPTTAVGNAPIYATEADVVIVEINPTHPLELEGVHDVYLPEHAPFRRPIPLTAAGQRIGTPYIPIDPDKITCIVEADITDQPYVFSEPDKATVQIGKNLCDFLRHEAEKGWLPKDFAPIQSGVGSVANTVLAGLADAKFTDIEIFSEVLQDSVLDLIDAGLVKVASGTSLTLSNNAQMRFKENIKDYRERLVLRPQEISNHPELIRRLGLIAINTALEFDIYGNVNSSHRFGTQMMNGIGGSGDFARNAALSIFVTESVANGGDISCIVPMVSHVDHTEHDVMVVITEQGIADLRGLTPVERAERIIENCAHPDYKPMLRDYFERACNQNPGQTPHVLNEALSWHIKYTQKGTMK